MKKKVFAVLLVMFMVVCLQIEARMMTNQEILYYPKFQPILNEDKNKTQVALDDELRKYFYKNDGDTLYPLTGFLDSVDFNKGTIVLMSRWAPIKSVYMYFDTSDIEFVNQLKKIATRRNNNGALAGVQAGVFLVEGPTNELGFRMEAKYVRVLVGEK